MATERLLLFDIDGTLVHINGLGRQMLADAMQAVYGTCGSIDTYSFAGKTDRFMIRELLLTDGWQDADIDARLPHVYRQMTKEGQRIFTSGSLAPCPGVVDLLAGLSSRSDVTLGLLTGNIRETAALKLQAAGIDPNSFVTGAYGADSAERHSLLAIAQRRAYEETGRTFDRWNTTLIGDTPSDIACAQTGGATSVAVSTGSFSGEMLQAYHPDFWFETLADTEAVLAALVPSATG